MSPPPVRPARPSALLEVWDGRAQHSWQKLEEDPAWFRVASLNDVSERPHTRPDGNLPRTGRNQGSEGVNSPP